MRVELSPRQAIRWLPYLGGLLSFHFLLLLTMSRLIGALSVKAPVYVELLLALPLLYAAQVGVSHYARQAWIRGYATGHWDGLEDSVQGPDLY